MITTLRTLAIASALLLPSGASAAMITFTAPLGLTGSQEVPPRLTPASGTGTAVYDTLALTLDVDLTWQNLITAASASHIHCCSGPGANSTVAIDFGPAGFPNATSGVFSHTFDLTSASSFGGGFLTSFGGNVDAARAGVVAGLLAGRAYFNIHTPTFPGGEIRGDIQAVPEPATFTLLALGLAAAYRRRRTHLTRARGRGLRSR